MVVASGVRFDFFYTLLKPSNIFLACCRSPFKKYVRSIHQFDISGLFFGTGSGRELGVKELCQLYVYNSILRVKQSSVIEI